MFAIGVSESGVTVASQQRRAIHLVDALLEKQIIAAGSRIAVIGGGAAGLTAAVRAATAGCHALVIARDQELLATLRGNTTRLLHPNLYSWPAATWRERDAHLPILGWSAAPAGTVAAQIEDQFRLAEQTTSLIQVDNPAVLDWQFPLTMRHDLIELRWLHREKSHVDAFAAIVLAVGFGRERRTGREFPGYWHNDRLQQAGGDAALRCLIQGAGDGGLTDTLRARVRNFDQAETFERLLGGPDLRRAALAGDIERIEIQRSAAAIDQGYRELATSWLDDAIRELGLRPHSVVLNDVAAAFGPRRFPLNKLLVSRLLRMREIEFVRGELEVPVPDAAGRFPPIDLHDGRPPREFDVVLVRVGPRRDDPSAPRDGIHAFGPAIVNGCRAMVATGIDVAREEALDHPPPGTGLRGLARSVMRSSRAIDLVETLLLFLRHAPDVDVAELPGFAKLRRDADRSLPNELVALEHADRVTAAIRDLLVAWAPHEAPAVAVRAIAEIVDHRFGDRLARALRGPAGSHRSVRVGPHQLFVRGLSLDDRRGRRDRGLASIALTPPGVSLQVEWTRRSWPRPLRVEIARSFDSMQQLALTTRAAAARTFFGVAPIDASAHRERLLAIASELRRAPVDFVVLPEFSLVGHPDWAVEVCRDTGCYVFGGVGHVQRDWRADHVLVAVLDPASPVEKVKSTRGEYLRVGKRWREDTHAGPARLVIAVSACGARSAVLTGEDTEALPAAALDAMSPSILIASAGMIEPPLWELAKRWSARGVQCVLAGIEQRVGFTTSDVATSLKS